MTDREKVIKGLEHCIEKLDTVVNKSHGFNCIACPYFRKCDRSGYLIGLPLMRDTLALLKAHEPIEARLHLCESCTKEYAECETDKADLVYGNGVGNDNVIGCPWYVNRWKAQEPRVMRISELTSGEPMLVWLEDIDKTETVAGMIFDYVPGRFGFKLTDIGSMDRIYPRIEDYLTRWRCWTSRPTDEQREAVKWE